MNTWKTISLSLVTGSNKTFQREGWEGGRNSVQGVMKSKDLISRGMKVFRRNLFSRFYEANMKKRVFNFAIQAFSTSSFSSKCLSL